MSQANCCDREHQPLLPVEGAIERLLGWAEPLTETEQVATMDACARVLAEDIHSTIDAPGFSASSMDGYALRAADAGPLGAELPVSQRIAAGQDPQPLAPGTAARIFTGAPLPAGADSVVMQEDCTANGDKVQLPGDIKPGSWVRAHDSDLAKGAKLLDAGTRLGPQHLGLAASTGLAELKVMRRLRAAVLSSGDELVMPGDPLPPGKIYNSNRFTLIGLLQRLGCEVIDLGIVPDTLEATMAALSDGARRADLVLATGGVSVGDEDHVKPAIERLGRLDLWKIAMRPGKPLAYGRIGPSETPFIGSPGNPVSLFVTFCLFARPFILRSQGVTGSVEPRGLWGRATFDWTKPDTRREYHRARLVPSSERTDQGAPWIEVFPSRSSATLASVTWAEGLVEIPEGHKLHKGDPIRFIPFDELLA